MYKLKYLLFAIPLLLFTRSVKADTLDWVDAYSDFDSRISYYLQNQTRFDTAFAYYQDHYQATYPYYSMCYSSMDNSIIISAYKKNQTKWDGSLSGSTDISLDPDTSSGNNWVSIVYQNNSFNIDIDSGTSCLLLVRYRRFTTDNRLSLKTNMKLTDDDPVNAVVMPQFTSSLHNVSIDAFQWTYGDNIPSYIDLYDGSYETNMFANYTEINLNDYAYIALSLKDYSITEPFSTNIYTKGQLCPTTLYNYGLSEKYNPQNGDYAQGCTMIYEDFTPVRYFIIESDLQNMAVYYFKAFNTNIPNVIKVDNDVFNITYITNEDADNPMIYANGRYYSSIPYDSLTSNSTMSEQLGIVSGVVCNLGDTNCYYQNTGIDISNLFTHPLQLLQGIWGSISTMFVLIFSFYSLLPPLLQTFMASAFMLAIVLGVLKIIL